MSFVAEVVLHSSALTQTSFRLRLSARLELQQCRGAFDSGCAAVARCVSLVWTAAVRKEIACETIAGGLFLF